MTSYCHHYKKQVKPEDEDTTIRMDPCCICGKKILSFSQEKKTYCAKHATLCETYLKSDDD